METLRVRIKRWQFLLGLGAGLLVVAMAAIRTFTQGGIPGGMGAAPKYLEAPKGELERRLQKGAGWPDTMGLKAMGAFLHWMDSLRQDSGGRREYDSLLQARPGLMDSAERAYEYYRHK
jgi:hypothetical protein